MDIIAKLKTIEELMEENPNLYKDGEKITGTSKSGCHWTINSEMRPFFGDGNYYSFLPHNSAYYTHKGPGEWSYHREWFVLDGKSMEESKPITIDTNILDIP